MKAPPLPATEGSLKRSVVRGGSVAALGLVLTQLIAFASSIALARLAPPAVFGAYWSASILLSAAVLFSESGMQAAVVQRQERLEEAASTAFVANLLGGLGLGAVAAALAPAIGAFFHSREIGWAAAAMAGTIPLTAAAIVPGAMLQRRISLRRALAEPLAPIAYGATAAALLTTGFGIWALVIGTYAAGIVRTVAIWSLCPWRPRRDQVSFEMWRSLAGYGRHIIFSQFLREVGNVGNVALVGRALGAASLGQYRYGRQLVMQSTTPLVYGSAYALLPAFSRIWRDEARFEAALLRVLRILSLVAFPISLGFVALGRPLVAVLFGDAWKGAGPVVMALGLSSAAFTLESVSAEVFKARARPDILPRIHGLTAVVPLVLMLAFLPLGVVGIGLAVSLGAGMVAAYAIVLLGRVSGIPVARLFKQVRTPLLAATAMAAVVFLLERYVLHAAGSGGVEGLGILLGEVATGAAVYFGLLLLFARESLVEIRQLGGFLPGRRTAAPLA